MVLLVGLTAAEIRVPLPTIVSVVNTMLTSKKHVINMENDLYIALRRLIRKKSLVHSTVNFFFLFELYKYLERVKNLILLHILFD